MFDTDLLGKRLLKGLCGGSHGEPPRLEDAQRRLNFGFVIAEVGQGTRQFMLVTQKKVAHLSEILPRLLIVLMSSQIAPIAIEGIAHDAFPFVDKLENEIWEVEVLVARDVIQHLGLEDVHAHAHTIADLAFRSRPRCCHCSVKDSQVDLDLSFMHGDGGNSTFTLMEINQLLHVECREHVAVHHHERFVQIANQRERTSRSKRLFLVTVRWLPRSIRRP